MTDDFRPSTNLCLAAVGHCRARSRKATGYSRHDHAVSIRSDESGVRLLDNACAAGSVEFTVENLADKMADLTYCFYFDLYKKGWKKTC